MGRGVDVLVGDGLGTEVEDGSGGAGGFAALLAPGPHAAASTTMAARRTVRRFSRLGVEVFIRPMLEARGNLTFTRR